MNETEAKVFSEDHRQEVRAWINLYEHLAYESILTRISEAQWQVVYARRKKKPSKEIFEHAKRVHRLQESQRRFMSGQKPSKFIK